MKKCDILGGGQNITNKPLLHIIRVKTPHSALYQVYAPLLSLSLLTHRIRRVGPVIPHKGWNPGVGKQLLAVSRLSLVVVTFADRIWTPARAVASVQV